VGKDKDGVISEFYFVIFSSTEILSTFPSIETGSDEPLIIMMESWLLSTLYVTLNG